MKNAILMSAVVLGLAACASHQTEPQPAAQPAAPVQAAQPAYACGVRKPQPACGVRAPQPAEAPKQACNACSKSYTVSEPVEVVYKNVTYTTVYEPKTYSNTTYVKKPYSCKEGENCPLKQVAPTPAPAPAPFPAPAPAPIIINE